MTASEDKTTVPDERINDSKILKNGTHEPQMVDKTDDAAYHPDDIEDPMLSKRNKRRKYKTYDNGKPNRINLSPLTSNGVRFEKIIKQKTGLTRTGLVLAVLCIVLAIALLVCIILWPKTTHSNEYPVCSKPSCLRWSAEILSKLNANESVCNNLESLACGGWFASNPLPKDRSEWNLKESLQYKYRQKVQEIMLTMPLPLDTSSLLYKLKTAYDTCMTDVNIKTDSELRTIIQTELGGWEVLHDFSETSWDMKKTLTILYAQYSVSPFFIIDVVPDITDSHKNIIRLRPPELGLPNKNYYSLSDRDHVIDLYKHFVKDIVQLFGATMTDATAFGTNLFYLEKRIAEYLDDDVSSFNYTRITIGDLGQRLIQIPLYDILLSKFPQANLKNTDHVLVSSMKYFHGLPQFISYTDQKALNNFLIWRLVSEYLPYFPEKYIDTVNLYRKELLGENNPIPRWEFCIATLQKFAGYGLLSLYENNLENREDIQSVVTNLFSEILNAIRKSVLSNDKNSIQSSLLDKLSKVGIQVGFPSHMLKVKYIDSYYSSFNAVKYSFYKTIVFGVNFIKDDMQRRLTNSKDEYKWIDNMALQPTKVTFNSNVKKVIVPLAALQQPFFEKEYTLPALYGGIGAEIAKAIVSGVTVDTTYYENSKKMNSYQNNSNEMDSDRLLQYLSDCILHRNIANANITDKRVLVGALTGLKYAYKSLKNELEALNVHIHQPALEMYENEELFFIFNAQSSCSVKTAQKENHEKQYLKIPSDKFLTNAVSTYLSEFTELFSCGEKSKYYDSSLCKS